MRLRIRYLAKLGFFGSLFYAAFCLYQKDVEGLSLFAINALICAGIYLFMSFLLKDTYKNNNYNQIK